jgi:hypothetical protein
MERERDVGNVETKWGGGGVINLDQIPVVVVAGTPLLGCLVLTEWRSSVIGFGV